MARARVVCCIENTPMAGFEHCKLKSTLPRLVQQPFLPTSEPPRRFGRSLISFARRFAIQQMQPAWCSSHIRDQRSIWWRTQGGVKRDKKEIFPNSDMKSLQFTLNWKKSSSYYLLHLFNPHGLVRFGPALICEALLRVYGRPVLLLLVVVQCTSFPSKGSTLTKYFGPLPSIAPIYIHSCLDCHHTSLFETLMVYISWKVTKLKQILWNYDQLFWKNVKPLMALSIIKLIMIFPDFLPLFYWSTYCC